MLNTEELHKNIETAIYASLRAGSEILNIYTSDTIEVKTKSDNSPLTIADKNANDAIIDILQSTNIPIISEEIKNQPYDIRKNWEYAWIVDPLDGTKEFVKRNDEFTVNIALIYKGEPIAGVIYTPVLDELYFSICSEGAYKLPKASTTIDSFKYNTLTSISFTLPLARNSSKYTVVGSRSHMNTETETYINAVKEKQGEVDIMTKGSSLKLCMIAEGAADLYPRFAPTSEWDIAAGHAIIKGAGGEIIQKDNSKPLEYNKEDILNPWFIASLVDVRM